METKFDLTNKQKEFIDCLIQWMEYEPEMIGLSTIPHQTITNKLSSILKTESYDANGKWLLGRLRDEFIKARKNGKVIHW
jgi:hypothetical protein